MREKYGFFVRDDEMTAQELYDFGTLKEEEDRLHALYRAHYGPIGFTYASK